MAKRTINIGIDLGTTNSAIAAFENDKVVICLNSTDEQLTPSVVRIDESKSIVVGRNAYQRLLDDSENTVGGFKRWMGTQQKKTFLRSGRTMSPEELSAEVLKELRTAAKENKDLDVATAVITVPASFESLQCDATVRAARLAGITHSPLLQEPIAAAIAYGLHKKGTKARWLVYDLGGGTFDAALIALDNGRLSVLDHSGDNYLGGSNFDERIVDSIIIPALKQEFDVADLALENKNRYKHLLARATHAAERAKIELTRRDDAVIEIQFFDKPVTDNAGKPINARIPIARSQYENLIARYIEKTIHLCQELFKRQHLEKSDLENIILVGGPTKTPFLRKLLKDSFGIPLEFSLNPMTVVAEGAAIFATAQFIPDNLVAFDTSKIQMSLQYEPLTTMIEPLIGGRISDYGALTKQYGQMYVQIKRGGGDWQSGKIPLQAEGIFATQIHLNEGKSNTFYLTLFDQQGTALPAEPDSFQIMHGLSVAEAPLIRSIGIGLEDGSFIKLLEKGEPLPARGRGDYRTTHALKAGDDQAEGLNILVYEGEYDGAHNNRYVGRLRITGKDIQRDVLENARIDVLLKVDEQRHVSVQAEVAGQKIEGIICDESGSKEIRLSPKPDVETLETELREQKRRVEQLKEAVDDGEPGEELKQQIGLVERDLENSDYSRDIQAAKGGDQTACEKLEREVKDLRAKIDAAEYFNRWPSMCKNYNDALKSCRWAVENHGNPADKENFATITTDAESILSHKDQKRLSKLTEALHSLYWAVLMRLDDWWIAQFQNLQKNKTQFKDAARAKQLIQEGSVSLKRNDIESLKTVMWELWQLMTDEERMEASRKLEHSGLRR